MNIILSLEASNITTLLNVSTGFRMPTKFTQHNLLKNFLQFTLPRQHSAFWGAEFSSLLLYPTSEKCNICFPI